MSANIKFYKIKLIKKLSQEVHVIRTQLLDELVINATDSVILRRRLRMIRHINQYESQLIKKIEQFNTDDPKDLDPYFLLSSLRDIVNRSA